jgi:ABC-type multidrug transport system fused ATPase/permease subunit
LRNAISIIPQNPVLFSGSLLYNLDATGRCTEDEAWAALEAASLELSSKFRSSPGGLNTEITEGGKNLSAGQRQLICLARALLRGCKILLLDEATSSVDSNTDAEVQDTIQREFATKGVTVITVAHRLETVLGSDMILVLGNGRVLEFDKPRTLAMNPKGHLRRLIDADRIHKKSGELELVK